MSSSPRKSLRQRGRQCDEQPSLQRSGFVRLASLSLFACLMLLAGCGTYIRHSDPLPQSPPANPPPTANQKGSVTITPPYVALAQNQKYQFAVSAPGGGQIKWLVNGVAGGNSTVGTVSSTGQYTAPAFILQSENIVITAELASSPQQDYATSVVSIIVSGFMTCPDHTNNPQVAQYSVYLPAPGKAYVQFGKTTSYGKNTWQVATPSPNGGQIQIWVAGMLGNTSYHMRGRIVLNDGATFTDADQTCKTGPPPFTPHVNISTPNPGTPQPGIEMWNTILPTTDTQLFATDLKGNVLWTYSYSHPAIDVIQGMELLPNGNLLMTISYLSSITLANKTSNVINEIREINLDGQTVRDLTMSELNKKLAASNLRDAEGNLYHFKNFHHDVLALPNGHWVVLTSYSKQYTNLPGYPGTTSVLGDAIVDLNKNLDPDWVWNTFDHLNINRHPMNFPDWTHANDLLYSSDDHNLLVSLRHQNWIIKIEFLDGLGSGKVMWRLGEGGDFKLIGGTDPTDWFYAQHGMSYFTHNTTGVFRIGMMDNGNDRIFPSGQVHCKPLQATTASCYSTVPVYEVNENNMTATLVRHYVPPPSYYSFFGGNAEPLANGDLHVDFCAPITGAIVQELKPLSNQVIWQATTPKTDQFHAFRLPSLYPGVQW